MCAPGESCINGMCAPPVPCTSNSNCPSTQICMDTGFCGTPPIPCTSNTDCPTGEVCDPTQHICVVPPTSCTTDANCTMYQTCDAATQTCVAKDAFLYEGGLTGCSFGSGSQNAGSGNTGLALLALLGLLSLSLRGRLARTAQKPVTR